MKEISYTFLRQEYYDLPSLATAYQNNFEEGMEDIFVNAKKLVKFVKKIKKNKEFTKEIVSYLYTSHYKNNALTFIIYAFSDYNNVVINGQELKYNDFINELKENPQKEDNALFAFLEDSGISKTYAKYGSGVKIFQESQSIERHCYLPFTYDYLTTYDDFEITESLNSKISSVAINGEECFRRGTKVTNNIHFQLAIAHKVGFKDAVEMNKDINPIFKAIKLLNKMNECEDEYLRKLISDTFYWWLLDNFDKYIALKKEAKQVFINLQNIKKEYDKYQSMIESKKIYHISIDLFSDMSRSLYLIYLEFVDLFKEGKIAVKSRFDKYELEFDKPYCKTYICQDYMNGKVIKLYSEAPVVEENEPSVRINPLTGEIIEMEEEITESLEENDNKIIDADDDSDDEPLKYDAPKIIPNKKLNKLERKMYKNRRFSAYTIFLCIINYLLAGAALAFSMLGGSDDILGKISTNTQSIGMIIFIVDIAIITIVIVLCATLRVKSGNTIERINDVLYFNNAKNSDKLSIKQEKKLNELSVNINKLQSQAVKTHRVLSCVAMVLSAFVYSVAALIIIAVADGISDFVAFDERILQTSVLLLSLTICPIFALVLGIVKKYKGVLSVILLQIIAIVSVIVLFIVL